jgi:Xaa-Pro aminopeptidase
MIANLTAHAFKQRREALLAHLAEARAAAILLAGDHSPSLHGPFKPETHFVYLTGITDEPGACLLLDPQAEDPRRREVLFLKPLAPETEAWDGLRDPITDALKQRYGFETVMRTLAFPRMLTNAARLRKRMICLHPCSVYEAPPSADLALYRKVAERVPGCTIEERSNLIPSMRAVKSPAELDLMRHAIHITGEAFEALRRQMNPGVNERDLQRTLESSWFGMGASANAYTPIIGAGLNSTVLHYHHNNQTLADGDVLLVDAAAAFAGYAADITRTYPISGSFTPRQRDLYQLVLDAQNAAIEAVKPGVFMHEIEQNARAVFRRANLDDRMIHGIGHPLGLDVHDPAPDGPLVPGMVVTIEPGLYIAEERIGIRIEDDILVTSTGRENLSVAIPKELADICRR